MKNKDKSKEELLKEVEKLNQRIVELETSLNEEKEKNIWQEILSPNELKKIAYYKQPYGNLANLNTSRVILDNVGEDLLLEITKGFLDLLGTSLAIYEANGDYALGIFASNWCRLLDKRSRELCSTADNKEALKSGKWHCHESCWNEAAKVSMQEKRAIDIECFGGIHLYAVPIWAGKEIIGSLSLGYGDPPKDPEKIKEISKRYGLDIQEVFKEAKSYKTRPPFIIAIAKQTLDIAAKLIGTIVEAKRLEKETMEKGQKIKAMFEGVPDAVFLADPDTGKIIDVNPAASQLLLRTHEEIITFHYLQLHPPEVKEEIEKAFVNFIKLSENKQKIAPVESLILRSDGSKIPVEILARLINIQDKKILQGVFRDLSWRKEMEKVLEKQRDELDERLKELNCLYSISNILQKKDISLETIFQKIVNIIPSAYQHPELTCARFIIAGKEYKTTNSAAVTLNCRQISNITVYNEKFGILEICCSENKTTTKLLLKEEQSLIDSITQRLGEFIENKKTEQYRLRFFMLSLDALCMSGTDYHIKKINPSFEKILGYTNKELAGKPFIDIIHPADRARTMAEVKGVIAGATPFLLKNRFQTKDGQYRWMEWNCFYVAEESLIYGAGRDITERKKVEDELERYRFHLEELVKERTIKLTEVNKYLQEEIVERQRSEDALRESETKYSTLVEQAKDGVIITQNKVCKFANKAMEEITGYQFSELTDKPISDFVITECKDLFTKELIPSCLISEKINLGCETKIKSKDGTVKEIEASTGVITYNGKISTMGIVRDITERKKTAEELQKAQRIESLGILAGGIAHDFNNLLTTIIGSLCLIRIYAAAKVNGNILQNLSGAEKASQQAKKLTQQLLTFSKGGEPLKKPVLLSKFLRDVSELALSGSNIKCRLSIQDNLWGAMIDEGQISQAISNLLINADQAMPMGGEIDLQAENKIVTAKDNLPLKEGEYIKISIKDRGMGIPKEYLQKIFDPYFTTKQKGSGLGLTITYSIIKKHDGHITLQSELGFGTIFSIYLPALEKEKIETEPKEKMLHHGKGKVLFMDDQEDVRDVVSQMLINLGYEVEPASDGSEAIKLYKKAQETEKVFDAVILDLTVPGGMGGREAIQKLLEIDPLVKVIVSSGYSNDPIMSEYKKYGFIAVIAKPYQINELSEVLYEVIKKDNKIRN